MSNEIPFLTPRFNGKRFDDHAIPLDMLKDLAGLESLVWAAAKWHYKLDRPESKRARGIASGLSLKLVNVTEGSAVPHIALFVDGKVAPNLFQTEIPEYLAKAKESILLAIDAAGRNEMATRHLPAFILGVFDRLFPGLRDDESIDFDPTNAVRPARLDKVSRSKLIQESQVKEVTKEVSLRGTIPEADQDKMTFQLQLHTGSKVTAPIAPLYLDSVKEAFAGYDQGVKVLICGIGKYSRSERLVSIESVESITILDANDVPARLDELRLLRDGWLDGEGSALDSSGLDWLSQAFESFFAEDAPLPFLYPTVESNIRAEWSVGTKEISLEIDLATRLGQWHGVDTGTIVDEEREFDLNKEEDWRALGDALRGVAGVQH